MMDDKLEPAALGDRGLPPGLGVGAGMLLPAPPTKPDVRLSRIRLSSQHILLRYGDWNVPLLGPLPG